MATTDRKNTILHVNVATKKLSEFQTNDCESDDDEALKIEFSSDDVDVVEKDIELSDNREMSRATTSAQPVCTRLRKSSRHHRDTFNKRTDAFSFDWLDDLEEASDDEILKTSAFSVSNVTKKRNTRDENFTDESHSTCEKFANKTNDRKICHDRVTEDSKLPSMSVESDDAKLEDVCQEQIKFPNKELGCNTASIPQKKKHSQSTNDKADNSKPNDGEDYAGLKLILKRCWLQRYNDEKINSPDQVNLKHKKHADVAKIFPESSNATNMKDSDLQKMADDDSDQTLTESKTKRKDVNKDFAPEKDKIVKQTSQKKCKAKTGSKKCNKTSKDRKTTKSHTEKKATEQQSTKQLDLAAESMETEARIAMEFPRHNWLARHLKNEKHLQDEQLDISNGSKQTFEKESLKVASSAVSTVSNSSTKCVALGQLPIDTNATTTTNLSLPHHTLLTKTSTSESKDSEKSQHISIVVPVQYYTKNAMKEKTMNNCKENCAQMKKEPFDQDAMLETVKNISAKTSKSSGSEKLAKVVNFERPVSYIVAPASRDNEALDLTTKPKDTKTSFALDLSKKFVKDSCNKTNEIKDAMPPNKDKTASNGLNTEEHRSSSSIGHTESQVSTSPNKKPFIVVSSRSATSTSSQKTLETNVKNPTTPSTVEEVNTNRSKLLTNYLPSQKRNSFPSQECALKQNLHFKSYQKSQTNHVPVNQKFLKSRSTPLPTSAPKPQGLNRKRPLSLEAANPSARNSKNLRITKSSTRSLDEFLPIIDVDSLADNIPEIKPRSSVPSSSTLKSKFFSTASSSSNTILMTNTRRKSLPESYSCANVKPTSKLEEAKPFLSTNNPLVAEQGVSKTMLRSNKDLNTAPSSSSELMINLSHKDYQTSPRLSLSLSGKHPYFDSHPKDIRAQHFPPKSQHPPPKSLTLEFKKRNVRNPIQSGATLPAGAVDSLRSSLPQNHLINSSPMARYSNSNYMPLGMPSMSIATNANSILSHPNYQLANSSLAPPRTVVPFKPTALRNPAIRSNQLAHPVHQRYGAPRFSRAMMGSHRLPIPSQQFFLKQDHNRSVPQHPRTHSYNGNSNIPNSTAILANLERSVSSDKMSSVKSFNSPKNSIDGLNFAAAKFSSSSDLGSLSAQEAGKLAADLQQQKFELEKQILNLRALEKKFQTPTSYNTNHTNLPRFTTEERFYNPTISLPLEQRSNGENPKTNNLILDKSSIIQSRPCSFQMISNSKRQLPMQELGMPNKNEQTFSVRNVEICVHCRKKAFFVCSGCRLVWYCSKQCQLDHWPSHSKQCA